MQGLVPAEQNLGAEWGGLHGIEEPSLGLMMRSHWRAVPNLQTYKSVRTRASATVSVQTWFRGRAPSASGMSPGCLGLGGPAFACPRKQITT